MHLQCHAIFLLSSFERIYTHTHPACPICWTTFAVRSLAEQSAAVRSKLILAKLSCKTNLVWLNKWDYVLKKTSPYILNQIISNYFCDLKKKLIWSYFHILWTFLLYFICVFFFSLSGPHLLWISQSVVPSEIHTELHYQTHLSARPHSSVSNTWLLWH